MFCNFCWKIVILQIIVVCAAYCHPFPKVSDDKDDETQLQLQEVNIQPKDLRPYRTKREESAKAPVVRRSGKEELNTASTSTLATATTNAKVQKTNSSTLPLTTTTKASVIPKNGKEEVSKTSTSSLATATTNAKVQKTNSSTLPLTTTTKAAVTTTTKASVIPKNGKEEVSKTSTSSLATATTNAKVQKTNSSTLPLTTTTKAAVTTTTKASVIPKNDKKNHASNIGMKRLGGNEQQTSHFAGFFLASIVAVFVVYGVYHNRQKIIAVVIEGRNMNGRGRRGKYNRLETTVEEAMPSMKSTNTAYVY